MTSHKSTSNSNREHDVNGERALHPSTVHCEDEEEVPDLIARTVERERDKERRPPPPRGGEE